MKIRYKLLMLLLGGSLPLLAQQPPINNSPVLLNGNNSNQFWSRAGNNLPGNNQFGTLYNSPIYTMTNNANRMKLNGDFTFFSQYPVNGFGTSTGVNTSGYLLLGSQGQLGGIPLYDFFGAFSQLHLNGPSGTFVQQFGFRPWMKTGVTFTDNNDLSYMGMRQLGTGFDVTETTIAWADNAGTGSGPDDMVFRFINGNGQTYLNDYSNSSDMDGLHVARFTGAGTMGLGNTFGINVGGPALPYNNPQSLLHASNQFKTGATNSYLGFMQLTYRRPFNTLADITGQGETATDGLRWGIDNQIFNTGGTAYLNSYLRWQEASSFIIQTEDGGTANIQNNERMRVTSIGALVSNFGSTYLGLTTPVNRTRIAISADGSNPITKPMSLLHLGYNTGGAAITPGFDGWRPWMDLGVFTSSGSDHVFLGLKPEKGQTGDRHDAVLSWGDNMKSVTPLPNGPDNFRIIFTSTTVAAGAGTTPATGPVGLEGLRMTPTDSTGIFTGVGGAPAVNNYGPAGNSINPTATLEVNSWKATTVVGGSSGLRFTNLNTTSPTIANPGTGVLAVNADGDVIYVPAGGGGGGNGIACWDLNGNGVGDVATEDFDGNLVVDVNDCRGATGPQGPAGTDGTDGIDGAQGPAGTSAANNGASISTITPNTVVWGQNLGAGATGPASLLSTREIPMNNNNVVFTDVNAVAGTNNRMGLGITTPAARLDVRTNTAVQEPSPTAINVVNNQTAASGQSRGISIIVNNSTNAQNNGINSNASNGTATNQGGNLTASNGAQTTGVTASGNNGTTANRGVSAGASSPVGSTATNSGIVSGASGGSISYGGDFFASGATSQNIAVRARVVAEPATQYAVRADAGINATTFAGFFQGNVVINGNMSGTNNIQLTSDSTLKRAIVPISSAMDQIAALNPVSYYYDTLNAYGFNFDNHKHYGFIAQDVEAVMPELVQSATKPAEYDSSGNMITAAYTYKGLNYNDFIALSIRALQEQQAQIDSMLVGSGSACCDSLATVVANQGHQIETLEAENNQQDAQIADLTTQNSVLTAESAEQQETIEDLNARLTQLENCLSGVLGMLCQMSQTAIEANTPEAQEEVRKQLSVVLSNKDAIILDQNVPNPFAEQTVINYSIPETVQKAQILFYTGEGRLLQAVDVTERGLGSVTVFGSDLSSGTYTYSLVADGKVVATKKMVKQ